MTWPTPSLLINFLGFQLLWPAAVLGAAYGLPNLAWGVLVVMLVLTAFAGGEGLRDLRMVLMGFLACGLLEPVWLATGMISYVDWSAQWFAPGWIWALWGGFAVSFCYCLSWLQTRFLLASVLGGLGGAFSVLAGIHLGAAEAPLGKMQLALVYGSIWALVVPFFAALSRVLVKSSEQPEHGVDGNA